MKVYEIKFKGYPMEKREMNLSAMICVRTFRNLKRAKHWCRCKLIKYRNVVSYRIKEIGMANGAKENYGFDMPAELYEALCKDDE